MTILIELWRFLKVRKKLWLAPFVAVLLIFGGLLILAQAPSWLLLYTHFSSTFLEHSMHIIGISAFYHDSAACLLSSGTIVGAAQEERFTRIKHDASFPINAIKFCLNYAGLQPDEIDFVVFYEKPFLKFERLLETYLEFAPRGFGSFASSMPLWIKDKLFQKRNIIKQLEESICAQAN